MIMLKFCFMFTFLMFSSTRAQNLTCNSNDFSSLLDFVKHLDSGIEGWNFNSSSPNCCTWNGISCDSSSILGLNESMNTGRVVKLELGRRRLNGNLSESLGNLDQLRTLNLSHNFLNGSIPGSILRLEKLEVLDLSYNDVSGWFPSSTNLPSIRILDISENVITGPAPVGICRNSTKILVMNLDVNYFSGKLGSELGNCSSMEDLNLGTNLLTGDLLENLFRLANLTRLNLQDNQFSGQLSGQIGNLSNLVHLDLSLNNFSGNLPDIFHSFVKLRYFSAQSNRFIGKIPISLSNSPTIASLILRNNSFDGAIDLNCSAMISLVSLDLATNKFHGKIPENLPNCPKLKTINFGRINFTGQVPESFKNFQSLFYLSLSNSSISNLTSALQILQNCKNLTTLVLTLNFRNEVMPSDPSLEFTGLKALVIANCRLTGFIPKWLSKSTKLQLLDLSWNLLEGTIPPYFGKFSSLFYLDLSNNSLTGQISKEFTKLPSLISGNITMGEASPDFPFFVRQNASLRGFKYRQILSFPPTIELGNNFLTGQIWPEFGNLKELHVFDLKCNNLSGSIPENLSGMRSLETMDLSFNNLNGKIPLSLTKLTFMSKFSVAHNNLSGEIPSGGQFSTYFNSSFEGNPGLCGDHGYISCRRTSSTMPQLNSKRKSRTQVIPMAVGIGSGAILLISLTLFLIIRSIRRKSANQEKESGDSIEDDSATSLVMLCRNIENNEKEIFLEDILTATDHFDQSNIIGCGGFGMVFKAILPDGRKLAIKRLSGEFCQMEREFRAEIETLSRAQHPNLVHLQGYCKYKFDRLLIYSYMENGSLDYWLHERVNGPGPALLGWKIRLQIMKGSAYGLAYLHLSCEPRILHRDIKSSNILLNEKFEAHLADFGLARLILPYDTHVSTDLVGTLGYIPPEYGMASVATYKGDIYSFGVVILELLTSRRPMDMCRPKGCRDLISWVNLMRREKREIEVFDPLIYEKEYEEEMVAILEIACLCLSESPRMRPGIGQLVSWLEKFETSSKSVED